MNWVCFFAPPEGGFIVIILCVIWIYVHFGLSEIGFVLHKKEVICREFSTVVEVRGRLASIAYRVLRIAYCIDRSPRLHLVV